MCDRNVQFFLDSSPKFHYELSGDGIQHAWGCAKNYYQGLEKAKNKGKDNFRNIVAKSVSREVLTTACCKKFALHVIWYIWAYKVLKSEANGNAEFFVDP